MTTDDNRDASKRLSQHPDRTIDDKFERVVAERDDLAGALVETERERDRAEAERDEARTTGDEMTRAVKRLIGERDAQVRKARLADDARKDAIAERDDVRQALRDVLAELKIRTTEERETRRLLDQTRAALHVALHHADANLTLPAGRTTTEIRAAELDGCRIALQDATEFLSTEETALLTEMAAIVAETANLMDPVEPEGLQR